VENNQLFKSSNINKDFYFKKELIKDSKSFGFTLFKDHLSLSSSFYSASYCIKIELITKENKKLVKCKLKFSIHLNRESKKIKEHSQVKSNVISSLKTVEIDNIYFNVDKNKFYKDDKKTEIVDLYNDLIIKNYKLFIESLTSKSFIVYKINAYIFYYFIERSRYIVKIGQFFLVHIFGKKLKYASYVADARLHSLIFYPEKTLIDHNIKKTDGDTVNFYNSLIKIYPAFLTTLSILVQVYFFTSDISLDYKKLILWSVFYFALYVAILPNFISLIIDKIYLHFYCKFKSLKFTTYKGLSFYSKFHNRKEYEMIKRKHYYTFQSSE